jgi:hypothetical protein
VVGVEPGAEVGGRVEDCDLLAGWALDGRHRPVTSLRRRG